jgi:flagellar hook-associated protein 1 FlgK
MSGSLTLALRTAQSGLITNQEALNSISNNIANVNTPGYSRKVVNMEQRVVAGAGAGVQISDVSRRVDEGLLKSLRMEISTLSAYEGRDPYYQRLQEVFGTPEDNTSLSHIMTSFNTAIETLAVNPANSMEQSEAVRQGSQVAEMLNRMSDIIQELRLQTDADISAATTRVGEILTTINTLNNQLISNQAVNADVTDLRDQRDMALDELSGLIDIRYYSRGDGDVVVFTEGGRTLVDNTAATMSHQQASALDATTNYSEGDLYGIYVGAATTANDITGDIRNGKLKGLLDMRDTVLPNLQSQIDEFARQMRDAVNSVHNAGAPFPGFQSMSGTRTFIDGANQTMKLNGTSDVTFALMDGSGNQTSTTTLNAIMQDASLGTGAQDSHGDWSISEVAATVEDWLQANGMTGATVALSDTTSGKLSINLNTTTSFLMIRDEADSANGSTAQDASITFDKNGQGISLTGQDFNFTSGTKTIDAAAGTPFSTAQAGMQITFGGTGSNNTTYTIASVLGGGSSITVVESITTEVGAGANDTALIKFPADGTETVSGFANFFGLNDFYVTNLADNIQDTKILSSGYTLGSNTTLNFHNATSGANATIGAASVTLTAGQTLDQIVTAINATPNIGVTATKVPDGAGYRLRLAENSGVDMVVTATGTFVADVGLQSANVRTAGQIKVRDDIMSTAGKISCGALQWDATKGAAGEYLMSASDDTAIQALSTRLSQTTQFSEAGGLAGLTVNFTTYSTAIIGNSATLASNNETQFEYQTSLTISLQSKSDNFRGVNMDEEMTQLMLYEQAYSAAARIITTVQKMFDALEAVI